MDPTKIKIVGARVKVTNQTIDRASVKLQTTFPVGYREYITTLGEGTLSNFVRVYPPWRILSELDEWRDRIRQYWFWDDGADVLTDEKAEESIIIADTLNGDELIFHPSELDRLFVLPRDEEVIFEAGRGLLEAVEWLCGSGKLMEPFEPREFTPFDSRVNQRKRKSQSRQAGKAHKDTSAGGRRQIAPSSSAPALADKAPDEVLQQLFLSLEAWEQSAHTAIGNAKPKDIEEYRALLASIQQELRATVEPFVSETFDVGNPSSYGRPAHYGQRAPRIEHTSVSGDIAEVSTCGDRFGSNLPKHLFRLVLRGDSWRLDGMWEITKSGRRKRVKMFL